MEASGYFYNVVFGPIPNETYFEELRYSEDIPLPEDGAPCG